MESGKEHEQLRLFEDSTCRESEIPEDELAIVRALKKTIQPANIQILPGWHNNVVQLREPVESGWDLLPPEAA